MEPDDFPSAVHPHLCLNRSPSGIDSRWCEAASSGSSLASKLAAPPSEVPCPSSCTTAGVPPSVFGVASAVSIALSASGHGFSFFSSVDLPNQLQALWPFPCFCNYCSKLGDN